jgi:hypothetical protein
VEGTVAPSAPRHASPRAVALYLVGLRPALGSALLARQEWVRRMGVLMEDARRGNTSVVANGAGRLGAEFGSRFRDSLAALSGLTPPPSCAQCHRDATQWLARLVEGCDVLVRVGRTGTLIELRRAQELFAESRDHARAFNAEHARIMSELHARVRELRAQSPPASAPSQSTRRRTSRGA